jgi:type III pantothenate kinase
MLLADIGNTRVHIYDGKEVIHLPHDEAIELYANKKLYYITVKHQFKYKLEYLKNWTNISDKISLQNSYDTMGIDRRALCLSHENGIFVSAGSAITVDVVEEGVYKGGFLLPGLKAYLKAYSDISSALLSELNKNIVLDELPQTTKDGISYGMISSIKMLIEKHQSDRKLYMSGGDAEFLSSFFDNALFDETLIFQGMKNALHGVYDVQ